MLIVIYILLGISILAPIYTYALYPFVLRLLPSKKYDIDKRYKPSVSVVIVGGNEEEYEKKIKNIYESDYQNISEMMHASPNESPLTIIKSARGEVVLVTNTKSMLLNGSISAAVNALSPSCVGGVCGMSRKAPDEYGVFHDGSNWKYENKIKVLESRIGCLSGGNMAICVIKRELLPEVNQTMINLDFLLPTFVTEKGLDVLFEPKAMAYEMEKQSESDLFKKHMADGASYYRSIVHFWRLLLPRKGSFVFWSHRVMKWLVPFNMIFLLLGCGILAVYFRWAFVLLILQLFGYLYLSFYYISFTQKGKALSGPIGKLSDFASYFMVLNVAWFCGLFKIGKE